MTAIAPPRFITEARVQIAAAAVLAATVLFNPLLAIVNGHVHRMSGGIVAAAQGAIVLAAFAIGATAKPAPVRWWVVAWALVLAFVTVSLLRGELIAKNLGDVLMIPAFICLGARLEKRVLIRLVAALIGGVALIGFWELLNPTGYGSVFKVLDYYVATRGFDPKQFYAGGDLFVSSERGGGRFLMAFTGWHRGSSLFLEPVSLGNWAGVTALFTAAFWSGMSVRMRAFCIGGVAAVLVTCDGRLALGVCVLMALWLPVAARIPARLAGLYLPAMILALLIARSGGYLPQSGDTLSGRFRGGLDLLLGMDLAQLFGLGQVDTGAVDAGWAYLVENQSFVVAIGLWAVVMLTDTGESADARRMKHGLALFIALCLPISYAILSVKTSALMWTVYGNFFQCAARRTRADDATVEDLSRGAEIPLRAVQGGVLDRRVFAGRPVGPPPSRVPGSVAAASVALHQSDHVASSHIRAGRPTPLSPNPASPNRAGAVER